MLSWNVQSFNNKAEEVLQVLSDNSADIALFQETWFSAENSVATAKIKSAGYNLKHSFREKRGAGVAALYLNRFNCLTGKCGISESKYSSFQHQCVIFNFSPKIHLITIYRHQEIVIDTFIGELENLLNSHSKYSHSFLLVGDFNVHFEKTNSPDAIKLENLLSSFGLTQHVSGSTHKKGHTIDLLFCNPFELDVTVYPVMSYELGDHYPVIFTLNNIGGINKTMPSKRVVYRKIKGIDIDGFKSDLNTKLDVSFNANLDFPSQYKLFSVITNSVLDKFAPQKTKTIASNVSVPWLDAEYKTERATRRKFERQWKKAKNKDGIERSLYVDQRKKCARLSSLKRSQYYSRLIKDCNNNQGSLFKVVSQVLDKNKHSTILPQYEKNPKTLANDFNNFYVNKVSKIRAEMPSVEAADIIPSVPFCGTVLDVFAPTTVAELHTIIKQAGIKTAFSDILPKELLINSLDVLLPYICSLINTSLATGSVEGIKESTIMPLLKKSGLDPEILKHYRPVADIVVISKFIERVVLLRLNSHELANGLQCHYQHGYKKFHSTETMSILLVNDVLVGFEKNSGTILILLDLSAAFDTVDIDKLLTILDTEYGVRGIALRWFRSFLVGRKQRVRIENTLSDYTDVMFGVPQGSVLGPVLFNIYTRSLYSLISKEGFVTSGYADDSNARQSFALSFQYNVMTQQVPHLLQQITKWMHQFFLKINPDKTEIILFTPDATINTINGVILSNGDCIRFSKVVKNLGFLYDKELNLDPQINSVVSHSYKLIKDIRDVRCLLSDDETEQLVHSVISNRLDYCNSLYFGLIKSSINKLQRVQNAAARLVVKRRKYESIRNDINNLHWLRIEQRIIFKTLVTVFKCLHEMAPQELLKLLTVRDPQLLTLKYVFMNTTFGRRSFSYAAPKLWNHLPLALRLSQSLENFKSQLKTFLFSSFHQYLNLVNMYV